MKNYRSDAELNVHGCIDALAQGACTEEEFLRNTLGDADAETDSAWNVLALIDQRYRRGELAAPLFNSLKSRITRRAVPGVMFESTAILPKTVLPQAPQQLGQILANRYRLERLLAAGEDSDLFKAVDQSPLPDADAQRPVTLRALRGPAHRASAAALRLLAEVAVLQRLSHPHIARGYAFTHDGVTAFLTREYVEGEDLAAPIERARAGIQHSDTAWAILSAIGSALSHAHGRGVIHGHLDAHAVLITRDGGVRVLGFGHVATPNPALPAAPEPTWEDDLRALAALGHQLLTGHLPGAAPGAAATPPRPSGVSAGQWRALRAALGPARPAPWTSLREWLGTLHLNLEPERLPEAPTARRRHPMAGPRPVVRWLVGLGALILGAAAGWLGATRYGEAAADSPADSFQGATPVSAPPEAQSTVTRPTDTAPAPPTALLETPATPPPDPPTPVVAAAQEKSASPHAIAAESPKAAAARPWAQVRFAADFLNVNPRADFVEAKLYRANLLDDSTQFSWWTEDGSAKAGTDYIGQSRIAHAFRHAQPAAAVFVHVATSAARNHALSFRICAQAGTAALPKPEIVCSVVTLPAARAR